jgi:hypothetical protein
MSHEGQTVKQLPNKYHQLPNKHPQTAEHEYLGQDNTPAAVIEVKLVSGARIACFLGTQEQEHPLAKAIKLSITHG